MDELTKIALIGTSKHTGPIATSDHPAAALAASLQLEDREQSLLLQCGAQAVYDLAGERGVTGIDPAPSAPPETQKIASPRLASLLQSAFTSARTDLVLDYLRQLRARQVALPFDLLPLLLESRDEALRRSLIGVLGERGAWLARQNPDWSFFARSAARDDRDAEPELKKIWDEGTIGERCEAIANLRRIDPAGTRELIAQAFAHEKPVDRVKLLESLKNGLCGGDEEFLEACLDDRSKTVGQTAAALLCLLPQTALAGRMRTRTAAMLTIQSKGPSAKKPTLACTPPQQIARDWERDGISKRAPTNVGERAYWVDCVLATVPPGHWSDEFGLTPRELIAAVVEDTFATAVLSGWTHAAARFASHDPASAEWLVPIWEHWAAAVRSLQGAERATALHLMHDLLRHLPPDHAFAATESLLKAAPGWQDVEALNFFSVLPRPFSAQFSASFLATVRERVKKGVDEGAYRWACTVTATACAIPVEAFHLALDAWETAATADAPGWHAAAIPRQIAEFVATIEARELFMKELDLQTHSLSFTGAKP
jgi:hypothetical protein